ncbi:L,D-transpeptidase family protein [Rhizobium sp. PAMB 3182]
MTLSKHASASMLAIMLGCAAAAGVAAPAHALTLMDIIRGRTSERDRSVLTPPPGQSQSRNLISADDYDPTPTVSSPRYYTYKPEAMRLVKIAVKAENATDEITTGSVNEDGSSVVKVSTDAGANQRQSLADARVRATNDIAAAVEAYYSGGQPLIWVSGMTVTDKAKAAVAKLEEAASVGLDPSDYSVKVPSDSYDAADPVARNHELMQFELELSTKVLAYVQDDIRGRVDPNKISGYHDFKLKTVNLKAILPILSLSTDVASYLDKRQPTEKHFQALKAELARLQAEAKDQDQIVIAPGTFIKPGMSDPELANVVAAIRKHGTEELKTSFAPVLASYQGTPDYTPELVDLVKGFQKEAGLGPDGIIGKNTINAMVGETNQAKINKIVAAMERSRWLPNNLGPRYVFINQPAYKAYYINGGQEQLSMKVVVGQPNHQTYFFQDEIQTVEFNPYWGVPQSIIINEMLPKLRRDPSYLDRNGYEVSYNGRKVSSSAIDWSRAPRVDVRQLPGSSNALGDLKILFPNAHAIYMHDTPAKSFFQRDVRALSHGCVRLAEPRQMAAAVLGENVDYVNQEIASGQNRAVPLPQKFPVYVSYFTAWPNKDGVVEYFDDVYSRDMYLDRAFKATSDVRANS